jgi:hypothetical protein
MASQCVMSTFLTVDVDECKEDSAVCHGNSECVNLFGAYQCKCRDGFFSAQPNNQHGTLCIGWSLLCPSLQTF